MAIETGSEAPDFDLEVSRGSACGSPTSAASATSCSSSTRSRSRPSARRRRSTCRRTCPRSRAPTRTSSSSPATRPRRARPGRRSSGSPTRSPRTSGRTAKAYGVFDETRGTPVRGTFLIDKDGVVVWSLVNDADTAARLVSGPLAASAGEPRPLRVGRREPAGARLPARRHEPRPPLRQPRRAALGPLPRRRARPARARRLALGAALEPRAARRRRARGAPPGRPRSAGPPSAAASPTRPRRRSDRVERLVLLDPAIRIPPHVGIAAAENARRDRSYVSFEEGIDRRYEESVLTTAPRSSSRRSSSRTCSPTTTALSLPLLPERGRRRLRRDDARAAAVRAVAPPDAARARRDVLPPLRRPARRASGRPGRPARVERIAAGTRCSGTRSTTPSAPSSASSLGRGPVVSRASTASRARRRRAELVQQRRVDAVEPLVRLRHGDGVLERAGAERAEHLAGLGRRPDAAEHARARREHGDGLFGPATRRAAARPSRARS